MAKLVAAPPVDVCLSTLDQQSPATDIPIGRVIDLINATVKQYQNPRAADGTVTHVKVEKRNAFVTLANTVTDCEGNSRAAIAGSPQLLFGGGDALRQVINNRLYTRVQNWVKDSNALDGDKILFPHTVRSAPLYTADSQAEAGTIAVIGNTACVVWREVAQTATGDDATLTPPTSSSLDGVRVLFRDNTTGAVIRPAFTLDPVGGGTTNYLKVRVHAFGGVFFVLQDYITSGSATVTIKVTAYPSSGATALGTATVSPITNNIHWHSTVIPTQGVVIAMPNNSTGVSFTSLTYSGSINQSTHADTSINCGTRVSWIAGDGVTANTGHIVAQATSGPNTILTPYRIVSSVANHTYPVCSGTIASTTDWVAGITGYFAEPKFSNDLVIAYTLMDLLGLAEATKYGGVHVGGSDSYQNLSASDRYPDQLNNRTITCHVPLTGSSTTIQTRYAMSLVSSAFQIGSDWVAWGYYPARKWGPLPISGKVANTHGPNRPADPSNFQPCWYLLPLASTQKIAGRLEYGLASADYQVLVASTTSDPDAVAGPRNRCLVDVATAANGAIMLPLGYRAEQNIPAAALLTQQFSQEFGTVPNATEVVYTSGDTVGVKLFTFGPDYGQAFAVNQTTYLPGLMANVVEPGEVVCSEHGLVAPECPWVQFGADVVGAPPGYGEFFYRCVGEYTTTRGKIYRSLPSAPFAFSNVSPDISNFSVSGHNLNPTNKRFVKYSIYRNALTTLNVAGTAQVTNPPSIVQASSGLGFTSINYKITNDLTPLYNNPDAPYIAGAATPYATGFIDTLESTTQADGEVLYTDQGFLPRYPAPSHRGGCVWQNRAWLVAYDNSLWFSGEIQEGVGDWFNPGQRVVVPTNEEITGIASMDSFLLIFCEKSVWYLPEGAGLPDATGSGTIPAAIRLPFEMGGTGFTSVIRQGCVYSSSVGGVWMITRSLDNVWIGQYGKGYLEAQPIAGMCIAGNNVLVNTVSGIVVYDTNLGGWGNWSMPVPSVLVTTFQGQAAFTQNGAVWVQQPGVYLDQDINGVEGPLYVPTSVTIAPVHIGGVRSWKRTWAIQLQGQVLDNCDLNVTLSYGDYADAPTTDYAPVHLTPGTLEEEFRPAVQLASSNGLVISDSQGSTLNNGAGFSLEVVSFYLGLEKGFKKLGASKRAKAA